MIVFVLFSFVPVVLEFLVKPVNTKLWIFYPRRSKTEKHIHLFVKSFHFHPTLFIIF